MKTNATMLPAHICADVNVRESAVLLNLMRLSTLQHCSVTLCELPLPACNNTT